MLLKRNRQIGSSPNRLTICGLYRWDIETLTEAPITDLSLVRDIAPPLELDDLWRTVDEIVEAIDPEGTLPPVVGGGRGQQPDLALVFINPTHRNQSTRDGWRGPRYPFIGTKPIWHVLTAADLFPAALQAEIARRDAWDELFARVVYEAVDQEGLYITNLVKRTGANAALPTPQMVAAFRDLLIRELQIVRHSAIVTFGAMPFKGLTGEAIRLADELAAARVSGTVQARLAPDLGIPVYPCYFPVGHGNPKAAIEMLRLIRKERRLG